MKRSNEKKLGEVLRDWVASQRRLQTQLRQRRIERVWAERMGPPIVQRTNSIRLVRGKLYLSISSASLRQELHMQRNKIRDFLNEELRERVVTEVIVK